MAQRAVGIAAGLWLAFALGAGHARGDGSTDAQPGILDVAAAELGAPELRLAVLGGYGYLGGVLGTGDRHHRTSARLAGSWRPLPWLTAGAELDARLDRHTRLGGADDASFVGLPRLSARAARALGPELSVAAQLGLFFPGSDAPSVVASAISADLLGIATYQTGRLRLTAQAGYRLDRSAETAADADSYSPADRLSLGVSEANAILAGVGASYELGRADLLAAWRWDLLVGAGSPPTSQSPMRAALGVSYPLRDDLAAMAYAQVRLSEAPEQGMAAPLAPALASMSAMLAVHMRFDLQPAQPAALPTVVEAPPPPAELEPARLTGRVTTFGYPLSGVEVSIVSGGEEVELETDADGHFELGSLEAGQASVRLRRDGYEPITRAVALEPGRVAEIDIELEQTLPPGQLRGVVRSFDGTPLVVEISVEPAGIRGTTAEDGAFRLDVPPGRYEVSFSAPDHQNQRRSVTIEENGVTILNVDLPR